MSKKETNETNEIVTISKSEYDELISDSDMLLALKVAGVDNWVGYDKAMEILRDE